MWAKNRNRFMRGLFREVWQLIKWLWTTVADAVRAILISGVVAGVAFLVYRFRDRLVEFWHRLAG